jgi:UDP-N-acetylglucosamine--N-acetylmuramyl-(pentapeptide) pyrophosphoryl-undecaprenol N-acetylglucosamine transferase
LNELVPQALAACGVENLIVRHQCGNDDVEATRARYADTAHLSGVTVSAYIDDMASAYRSADVVIARAGAGSIAEIAASGVASILIPFPYAVDDHQTANARYLSEVGAAVLLPQASLTVAQLAKELGALLKDAPSRAAMAARARERARPQAASDVAAQCLELLDA